MRSKEFITELFSSVYNVKIVSQRDTRIVYQFDTENAKYDAIFFKEPDKPQEYWEFMFTAKVSPNYKKELPAAARGYAALGNGITSITNTGNSIKVMSTIVQILSNFMDRYNPNEIAWAAHESEESRIKLYNHLVKRFKQLATSKGYNLEVGDHGTHFTTYFITKK